jgi:hypothetical protein
VSLLRLLRLPARRARTDDGSRHRALEEVRSLSILRRVDNVNWAATVLELKQFEVPLSEFVVNDGCLAAVPVTSSSRPRGQVLEVRS